MSLTESFVDARFLAQFGLSRVNVLDYFMHPLNPFLFKTEEQITNQLLSMQGIDIGSLMYQGSGNIPPPLSLNQAEDEYNIALTKLNGHQYELVRNPDDQLQSPLYTIRHVFRTSPTTSTVLEIFYIVEGVIYKAPSASSVMKANVALILKGLESAYDTLNVCTRCVS
jgi:hypothetical protein